MTNVIILVCYCQGRPLYKKAEIREAIHEKIKNLD